jgi:hypothetical protein
MKKYGIKKNFFLPHQTVDMEIFSGACSLDQAQSFVTNPHKKYGMKKILEWSIRFIEFGCYFGI